MGGVGSGSWPRWDKKTTTGECHAVDFRYLHRNGLRSPGQSFSLSWSRAGRETGSICGIVYRDRVVLSYSHRGGLSSEWENVEKSVSLEWTPCNFGGERPWFICPGVVNGVESDRRVAVLYGAGKYFLCRHCNDPRYASQRKDKKDRALRRAKDKAALGRECEHAGTIPREAKGDAPGHIHEAVVGVR